MKNAEIQKQLRDNPHFGLTQYPLEHMQRIMGCLNTSHDRVDCQIAKLPPAQMCRTCREAVTGIPDELPGDPLRILPDEDDPADAIAREVRAIAHMPLVGGQPEDPARPPARYKFVNVDRAVMRGRDFVCTACSKTMAKRIANALNIYQPNREGV